MYRCGYSKTVPFIVREFADRWDCVRNSWQPPFRVFCSRLVCDTPSLLSFVRICVLPVCFLCVIRWMTPSGAGTVSTSFAGRSGQFPVQWAPTWRNSSSCRSSKVRRSVLALALKNPRKMRTKSADFCIQICWGL